MTIDALLAELPGKIILRREGPRIRIWAPNVRIARDTRAAIRTHSEDLVTLIDQADHRVCYNRELHRRYWRYAGAGRYVCEACEWLDKAIA